MKLLLQRQPDANCPMTFGDLYAEDGSRICLTLEEPWRNNLPNVSCAPAGHYRATLRVSHLNGGTGKHNEDVWELVNVPNREAIELHIGNTLADTEGCILLGTTRAHRGLAGFDGVLGSRTAFNKLMNETAGLLELELEIRDAAA